MQSSDNFIERVEHANFQHLVGDVAWFGLALAATTRFLSIYAIRIGASAEELSLLASLPGIMLLFSTGLSRWWRLHFQDTIRAIYWPALGMRFVFLLPALAPLFPREWQPIWLVAGATLAAMPQGVAGAIFIVLMRESVGQSKITRLMSHRSVALNLTVAAGAIGFGILLTQFPFPQNYQAMFLLAFLFSLISQYHVTRLKVLFPEPLQIEEHRNGSIWYSRAFLAVGLVALVSHIAFFSIITMTPLYLVEGLGADEKFMSVFGLAELAGGVLVSAFTDRIVRRVGLRTFMSVGLLGTSLSAILIASAMTLEFTLLAALISGASWTATTIGLFSYLIHKVPAEHSTSSSVAYQQVIAVGVFVGPMIGGILAGADIALTSVIMVGAVLRLLAGVMTYWNIFDMVAIPRLRRQHQPR